MFLLVLMENLVLHLTRQLGHYTSVENDSLNIQIAFTFVSCTGTARINKLNKFFNGNDAEKIIS